MNNPKQYKSLNITLPAFAQLKEMTQMLSTDYAKVCLTTLLAQLIAEKYASLKNN